MRIGIQEKKVITRACVESLVARPSKTAILFVPNQMGAEGVLREQVGAAVPGSVVDCNHLPFHACECMWKGIEAVGQFCNRIVAYDDNGYIQFSSVITRQSPVKETIQGFFNPASQL